MSRMTRRTQNKLRLFIAITVATVAYSAHAYLDVTRLVGIGYYDIDVELADGGGLYPGSLVTLRGAEVGEVRALDPGPEGVRASLRLRSDVKIPRTATADVRSISAAGEQYLDFAGSTRGGGRSDGHYAEGDTVPVEATHQPIATADLLRRVDGLVSTIPTRDLNTTLDEVGVGLSRGATDLDTLLDAILPLQEDFTENRRQTQELIQQARGVLRTQRETDAELTTAASGLAAFTRQLERSDRDLRRSLEGTPALTTEVTGLVEDLGPTLPVLLGSLSEVGQVASVYDAGVRHILTVLPGVAHGFQTALNVSPVEGAVSLFARSVVNDPPPCTSGFVQERRSPRDVAPLEPPTGIHCQVPSDSPQAVRGARNYPCLVGTRRGPSARACGLQFQDRREEVEVQLQALHDQVVAARRYLVPGAKAGTSPYEPLATGDPSAAGPLSVATSGQVSGDSTWESLVLSPLGLS